eukprot:249373-Pyramimonas_sp.AAC.1
MGLPAFPGRGFSWRICCAGSSRARGPRPESNHHGFGGRPRGRGWGSELSSVEDVFVGGDASFRAKA